MDASLHQLPMTANYLRLLCRAYSAEADRILAGTNLNLGNLDFPSLEISLFQQVQAIDNLLSLYGPGFVFLKPNIWNTSIHGTVAIAAFSAPTIGDAVAVLPRYGPTRTPFQRGVIKSSGAYVLLDWEVTVPLAQQQWLPMMEVNFLGIRSMISAALGVEAHELEFSFAAPTPSYLTRAREVLGKNVQYGAPTNRVKFPRAWWPMRSVAADPVLYERTIVELERSLQRRQGNPFPLQGHVERLLQTMQGERPNAEMVAASLGLSRRTMVRRLQKAGTSFRELLDTELRRRAISLREAKLRRDDIASRLGYQDPASFNRVWRRWFGPTRAD